MLTDFVEFWKLNNSLVGENGNTLVSTDGLTHYAVGKLGQGWMCTSGVIAGGSFASLVSLAQSYTIACWVYLPSDTNCTPLSLDGDATSDSIKVYRSGGATKRWRSRVYSGVDDVEIVSQSSAAEIAPGWTHLAVTCARDGAATAVKLYVNGVQVGTTGELEAIVSEAASWQVTLFLGGLANAIVDAVGVWQRALTDEEIAALYNAGAGWEPTAADTTPDAFAFDALTGAARNTQYTTDATEITGMDAATAISIADGEYSINGGAYTAVAGTIDPGDTLRLRATSSPDHSTTVTCTVTVGTLAVDWEITTGANQFRSGSSVGVSSGL